MNQRTHQAPRRPAEPPQAVIDDEPEPRTAGPEDRRRAATTCAWCGTPIQPKPRGRIPKWCSPSCRQRAWEQARAAASGLSAVTVVERQVEVRTPTSPTRRDWSRVLQELAHQLDDGRIYDRDLPEVAGALDSVLAAYRRRPFIRDRDWVRHP